MACWLKQSTAVDVGIGPFLDSTDGNTQETALTITQPDIRLKKNGGAWAQKNAAQTLSHEEAGWYEVALDTTDTNTLGILIVAIHESGALAAWREFMVVPANTYDTLISGTDVLTADVTQWNGTAVGTPATAGYPVVTLKDDLYHADIQFTRDQANTTDEWSVTWFKNGVRVSASVTSPTLQLVKRADGTDLKAATAMTEIGTTESYKLDLTTTDRVTVGEAVIAIAVATIDGSSRSFSRLVGRDSS